MICPNCGFANESGAGFCGRCGARIAAPPAAAKRNWLWLVPIVLILVATTFALYWFATRPAEDPTAETNTLPNNQPTGEIEEAAAVGENELSLLPATEPAEVTIESTATAVVELVVLPTEALPTAPPLPTSAAPAQTPAPTIVELLVDARLARNMTGVQLQEGQLIRLEYLNGSWRAGPLPTWPLVDAHGDPQVASKASFPVPSARLMTLVGGIGDQPPFVVGLNTEFQVSAGGELWLGPNDDGLADNAGSLNIRLTITGNQLELNQATAADQIRSEDLYPVVGNVACTREGASLWDQSDVEAGNMVLNFEPGVEVTILEGPQSGRDQIGQTTTTQWYRVENSAGIAGWIMLRHLVACGI